MLRLLWYSPALLGKLWIVASGLTEEKAEEGRPGLIFGASFVLELVAALVLSLFIGPEATLPLGLQAGFLIGLSCVGGPRWGSRTCSSGDRSDSGS